MIRLILCLSLLLGGLFCAIAPAWSQSAEWLFQAPRYYRKILTGSSSFVVDKQRGGIMYNGGPYDSYFTTDGGETWRNVFTPLMAFLEDQPEWQIDHVGRWYYTGNIHSIVSHCLVSDDAGESFRYLIKKEDIPTDQTQRGLRPTVVQPDAVMVSIAEFQTVDTTLHGLYSSCDLGETWARVPLPEGHIRNSHRLIEGRTLRVSNGESKVAELEMCVDSISATDIPGENIYLRMGDGSVLVQRLYDYHSTLRILPPGDTVGTLIDSYKLKPGDTAKPFFVSWYSRVDDSTAVFFCWKGPLLLWRANIGLQVISFVRDESEGYLPSDFGLFGNRILVRSILLNEGGVGVQQWFLLDLLTGRSTIHVRAPSQDLENTVLTPNNSFLREMFAVQRVIPVTDSVWLATLSRGEILRSTDAGSTWNYVLGIEIDDRWGRTHHRVTNVEPLSDGAIALVTNRLLMNDGEGTDFTIRHMAPFNHYMDISTGPPSVTMRWVEDNSNRLLLRYGPSSVVEVADRLWASGDAVTSFKTRIDTVDTVLHQRTRFLKRLGPDLVVAAMDTATVTTDNGASWRTISTDFPVNVRGADTVRSAMGDVTVADNGTWVAGLRGWQLLDTNNVYVDSVPGGIILSHDEGRTWSRPEQGIGTATYVMSVARLPTGTLLAVGIDVQVDPRLYSGSDTIRMVNFPLYNPLIGQFYIWRSTDNGRHWHLAHTFDSVYYYIPIGNVICPLQSGDVVVLHPTLGLHVGHGDGTVWRLNNPFLDGTVKILDIAATDDGWLHCGTDKGYVRFRTDEIVSVQETTTFHREGIQAYVDGSNTLNVITDQPPSSVSLYSSDGRKIAQTAGAGMTSIDLPQVAVGTYIVVAHVGNEVRSVLISIGL